MALLNFYSLSIFLILGLVNQVISDSPGARECHCLFTYDNAVYLFGGDIKWNNSAVNSFFHKAKMPFTTSSIPWEALNTTNAFNICDMTCIVEPSLSLLIFQPRSILIEPMVILIWGGLPYDSPFRVIYRLNMTVNPWKWESIEQNATLLSSKILNCVGIARSRDGVFVFGGIDRDTPIIENGENREGAPLPFNFTHSVVGVIGDFMHIIVLSYNDYLEDNQISIIPLNFARFKFESPVVTSTNLTETRFRAAGVQPSGSDVVLIYGGIIYQNSSAPETGTTLDTMLVYNMTLRSWTDTVNLVTDVSVYNFDSSNTVNTSNFPKFKGTSITQVYGSIGLMSESLSMLVQAGWNLLYQSKLII
ncbi:5866_t:CDS:2 [Dentiscutata erythropus]|uniref:5866_t:CDS:1 n=1 Tax=Dentiscutata erythropus TaxID=1348616 RepID=A0A9N9I6X7_9GLOM|nr:5866_t:CDS:2 [Dentiscutata erythropus]